MTTQYETSTWYGWNGGECPVHPKTVVEVSFDSRSGEPFYRHNAGNVFWENGAGPSDIIAFRIVTPYVEPKKPREFTLYVDEVGNAATWAGGDMMPVAKKCETIKVREVIEADDQ